VSDAVHLFAQVFPLNHLCAVSEKHGRSSGGGLCNIL
jgi:hypothetical protein